MFHFVSFHFRFIRTFCAVFHIDFIRFVCENVHISLHPNARWKELSVLSQLYAMCVCTVYLNLFILKLLKSKSGACYLKETLLFASLGFWDRRSCLNNKILYCQQFSFAMLSQKYILHSHRFGTLLPHNFDVCSLHEYITWLNRIVTYIYVSSKHIYWHLTMQNWFSDFSVCEALFQSFYCWLKCNYSEKFRFNFHSVRAVRFLEQECAKQSLEFICMHFNYTRAMAGISFWNLMATLFPGTPINFRLNLSR